LSHRVVPDILGLTLPENDMTRTLFAAAALILSSPAALADANLITLGPKGDSPSRWGYSVRTVEHSKTVSALVRWSPWRR
jgi:hypothetical protein